MCFQLSGSSEHSAESSPFQASLLIMVYLNKFDIYPHARWSPLVIAQEGRVIKIVPSNQSASASKKNKIPQTSSPARTTAKIVPPLGGLWYLLMNERMNVRYRRMFRRGVSNPRYISLILLLHITIFFLFSLETIREICVQTPLARKLDKTTSHRRTEREVPETQ